MRLVITSDTHGMLQRAELPAGDVLIICGDALPNKFPTPQTDAFYQLNELRSLDEFCGRLGFKHTLLIAGNHDWCFEYCREAATHSLRYITYLQDEGIELGGIKFYGSPHQPWFYDWAFNLPRKGAKLEYYWSLIPEDTDVLITHGPPYGILDRPFGRQDSAGCELLLERVKEVRPRVHCFGHIHGSYGRQQIDETLFINASLCNEIYMPVNPPQIVDL